MPWLSGEGVGESDLPTLGIDTALYASDPDMFHQGGLRVYRSAFRSRRAGQRTLCAKQEEQMEPLGIVHIEVLGGVAHVVRKDSRH